MKDRKFKRIFLCLLAVLVLAVSSAGVFAAEFTDENGQMLVESCKNFVEGVYTYDDTELAQMRDMGDFYLVTSDMVLEEKEELGDFIEVMDGGTYEVSGDSVMVHIPARYQNYTAQIAITFDETGTEPKNFVINPDYTLGEKMMGALQNFILGFVIVFVVLIFLAFIISLLKFVNPDLKKKREEEKAKATQEQFPDNQNPLTEGTAAPVPAAAAAAADDAEMIAVMAAAIAAAEAGNGGSYVVRSIRRAGTARNWTRL